MSKLMPAALALSLLVAPSFLATSARSQGTAITPGQSIANSPGSAPQAAPAAPAPAAKPMPAAKAERSAKSKDCSAEADKQGLHGKARKAFRSKCKSGKV